MPKGWRAGSLTTPRPALGRQGRPGGVLDRGPERQLVPGLVVEPTPDPLGIAQFPGEDPGPRREIGGWAAEQRIQLLRQKVAVEKGGVGLLDLLDRAALDEKPLDRIERREAVVLSLKRPNLAGNAEEIADEILEMSRQIDDQIGFGLAVERVGRRARRHQPVVQRQFRRGELSDKRAVEPHQPVALVKIGKTEPVFQGEFDHGRLLRDQEIGSHPANRRDGAAISKLRNRLECAGPDKSCDLSVTRPATLIRQRRIVSNWGVAPERCPGRQTAQAEHQPVGGGVDQQAELVGGDLGARGAVGGEVQLVRLDQSLPRRKPGSSAWGGARPPISPPARRLDRICSSDFRLGDDQAAAVIARISGPDLAH